MFSIIFLAGTYKKFLLIFNIFKNTFNCSVMYSYVFMRSVCLSYCILWYEFYFYLLKVLFIIVWFLRRISHNFFFVLKTSWMLHWCAWVSFTHVLFSINIFEHTIMRNFKKITVTNKQQSIEMYTHTRVLCTLETVDFSFIF